MPFIKRTVFKSKYDLDWADTRRSQTTKKKKNQMSKLGPLFKKDILAT